MLLVGGINVFQSNTLFQMTNSKHVNRTLSSSAFEKCRTDEIKGLEALNQGKFLFSILLAAVYICAYGYIPRFYHGRPRGGFVKHPDPRFFSDEQLWQLRHESSGPQWFVQRLDHFSPTETRTWRQKYFKAGPSSSDKLFVMIGGEGAASEGWMVSGMWTQYAQDHNAVRLQLEHRYYGDSHPTENLSVENMRYLSSEQALADLATFISAKKKEFGASKVIVFGGSYSGALSAWFRLKYPYLADAAVATSAPVLAQVDFKGYLEVVSQSLNTFKPVNACDNAISAATVAMKQKLNTPLGRSQLKKMFNLCKKIDISAKNDIANLFAILAGNIMGVVQYNKIIPGTTTIHDVCTIMTDQSVGGELERYAKVNSNPSGSCLDYSYKEMIEEIKNINWTTAAFGYRQWVYQTCTEFGYYQSSDSESQPFGHEFPIQFSTQQCADIFGSQFTSQFISGAIDASNVNYGARHYTENRVVFVNGNIDPWHYLGIIHKLPQAPVIYINGTAHCANMYSERPDDPPGLIQARKDIAKLITQWLHEQHRSQSAIEKDCFTDRFQLGRDGTSRPVASWRPKLQYPEEKEAKQIVDSGVLGTLTDGHRLKDRQMNEWMDV
ncbi:hypothetical protein RRG08_054900 [Elysia crispata]|uniref:Serine protease K12H4.7 n=1 Tax=Elysia crispata TaxID=231223 RepID=A0AAE1DSM1_9GAST|nr:hypothetical protein RRG08_054900 [Elysia crispata]